MAQGLFLNRFKIKLPKREQIFVAFAVVTFYIPHITSNMAVSEK